MGREKCCRGLSCDKSTKRCKVKITPSDLQKQKDKLKNVRKDDDSTCLEAGESVSQQNFSKFYSTLNLIS